MVGVAGDAHGLALRHCDEHGAGVRAIVRADAADHGIVRNFEIVRQSDAGHPTDARETVKLEVGSSEDH